MAAYLYLDTETTGLRPYDRAYQVAWQLEINGQLGELKSAWLALVDFGSSISEFTRESSTYIAYRQRTNVWRLPNTVWKQIDLEITQASASVNGDPIYLVGANPSFDDRMLRAMNCGLAPSYHHRLIDIEAYYMGLTKASEPMGLGGIAKAVLPAWGSQPHDAVGDVKMLAASFRAIRGL